MNINSNAQEPIMTASKNTEESIQQLINFYNTRMKVKGLNPGIQMKLLNLAESILSSTSQALWWIDLVLAIQILKTFRLGQSLPYSLITKRNIFIMQMLRI